MVHIQEVWLASLMNYKLMKHKQLIILISLFDLTGCFRSRKRFWEKMMRHVGHNVKLWVFIKTRCSAVWTVQNNCSKLYIKKNLLCLTTWSICYLFIHVFMLYVDSLNGPFPSTSHRCHHKSKRCLPVQPCGNLSSFPLLFHPSTKGSQIIMDLAQRAVKRQASFCNAITFSNRPIAIYEQVRLKVNSIYLPESSFCLRYTPLCLNLSKLQDTQV